MEPRRRSRRRWAAEQSHSQSQSQKSLETGDSREWKVYERYMYTPWCTYNSWYCLYKYQRLSVCKSFSNCICQIRICGDCVEFSRHQIGFLVMEIHPAPYQGHNTYQHNDISKLVIVSLDVDRWLFLSHSVGDYLDRHCLGQQRKVLVAFLKRARR